MSPYFESPGAVASDLMSVGLTGVSKGDLAAFYARITFLDI